MQITKPTLLIDKGKCLRNLEMMAKKAKVANAKLRPHFKTHHSAEVGEWFRAFDVTACTASSVDMADYFSNAGWDDITIAFPYNPLESEHINTIATRSKLNILIESEISLEKANELITEPVGYFIKLDLGTHRTGIDPNNERLIRKLVERSNEMITFQGFLGHAGHTYSSNKEEIEKIFHESVTQMQALKEKFGGILTYGDTPSCSMMDDLSAFDEIRAGNFVFYDWMQKDIGSCNIDQIAVSVACPIVAIHEDRSELVVYGGGVHLSKDLIQENGKNCFGKAVRLTENGWESNVIGNVRKLSQEHGVIEMDDDVLSTFKVGDVIGILPIHSCLAADLQGHYYLTSGERISKISKT